MLLRHTLPSKTNFGERNSFVLQYELFISIYLFFLVLTTYSNDGTVYVNCFELKKLMWKNASNDCESNS